jgi:two-component system phosphate regulon response regulator PhoB
MSADQPHGSGGRGRTGAARGSGLQPGREGFRVAKAETGDEALVLWSKRRSPICFVLDWMLPGVSGIEVCRRLKTRPETRGVPIIMLSARSEEVDRVRGLETGADDYVVKPYSLVELMARVRTQLRRARPATVGERWTMMTSCSMPRPTSVTRGDTLLKLGPTEFRLLSTFMEKPGRVWSREQLLDRVWGRDIYVDTRTVDVHAPFIPQVWAGASGETSPNVHRLKHPLLIPYRGETGKEKDHGSSRVLHASAA